MNKCDDDLSGLDGCQAPVVWIIKGAAFGYASCGRHLNRVCIQMVNDHGLEFMTISIYDGK